MLDLRLVWDFARLLRSSSLVCLLLLLLREALLSPETDLERSMELTRLLERDRPDARLWLSVSAMVIAVGARYEFGGAPSMRVLLLGAWLARLWLAKLLTSMLLRLDLRRGRWLVV